MTIFQRRRGGFTLMELLVVLLIVGVLASIAIPSYLMSVEAAKADDAVALVNMIGTTNKMFALDHGGTYAVGTFPTTPDTGCGGGCPAGPSYGACALVQCKYLADQNFGSKPYTFYACAPGGAACPTGGAGKTAGAQRNSGAYTAWGYAQDASGVITAYGSAPAPTY